MNIKKIVATAALMMVALNTQAQQEVEVGYSYDGNANLSSIQHSLRIAEFADERQGVEPALIANLDTDYIGEAPLAELVRDAFVQIFSKGGAEVVDSGEGMVVAGTINSAQAEIVDRSGVETIQLTIRTQIQLQDGGRTIYETTLFGRGRAPASEGMAAAARASLDRMVNDLARDNYFMIELE
ncbi:MAG: LPS assembly lipoprotein LptE [Gammaproteobacteria bacterium]